MVYTRLCKQVNPITAIVILLFVLLNGSCSKPVPEKEINHLDVTDRILNRTNDLLNGGQTKKADLYFDSAFRAFPNPGTIDLCWKYSHKVNFHLYYELDLKKARLYADSMLAITKDKKDIYKKEYAWTFFVNGEVLLAEKKYAEAFKEYYDGREFIKKNLDPCAFNFSDRLGIAKYRQEQYLEAITYLKQAQAQILRCETDPGKRVYLSQSTLNTIAICYEKSIMPDSAIVYYKKAIATLTLRGVHEAKDLNTRTTARGVIYGNLGGVYSNLDKFKEAEKYLKESIRINDRIGYEIQDAQTAKVKLADLYIRYAYLSEAGKLLDELQAHLALPGKNPSNENIRLKWHKLKAAYLDKTGNTAFAYRYSKKYHEIKDSINVANKELKNADMDISFKENEQQYELTLISKENELKTGYLGGAVIFSLSAMMVLTIVWQNRSRLRILNKKIRAQNSDMHSTLTALEQSQDENTRMMSVVAHDLRSPMAATISIADLLLKNKDIPDKDKEMLGLMKTSSQHSLDMIADLLYVNTSADELNKEPVELHTLLQYCVSLLKFKADEKKQEITLQTFDIVLNLNREKIWRVFSNLIVNAIKFSSEGAAINIGMQPGPDTVQVSIQDHGIGIPKTLENKIFNIFTDARRAGTSGEQSFGLGLAISKQIVEAHGGKIWFESEPGNGTIFYVELPVSKE